MSLRIATFNVKDLLDVTDPSNASEWAQLDAKIECIAPVIERADADVIALQEVGSSSTVNKLRERLKLSGGAYSQAIVGTPDARGIRCAVLSRFPVKASSVHTAESLPFPVFQQGDRAPFEGRMPLRRGVVYANVDAGPVGDIDVLVAHFKSRRPVQLRTPGDEAIDAVTMRDRAEGEIRSLAWRAAEALHVRVLVDELFEHSHRKGKEAQIAVVGDLNDDSESVPVRIVRGTGESPEVLCSCVGRVPEAKRFTVIHKKRRAQIDHILVSQALFLRLAAVEILNEGLGEHTEHDSDSAVTLDSDHALVYAQFERK